MITENIEYIAADVLAIERSLQYSECGTDFGRVQVATPHFVLVANGGWGRLEADGQQKTKRQSRRVYCPRGGVLSESARHDEGLRSEGWVQDSV